MTQCYHVMTYPVSPVDGGFPRLIAVLNGKYTL